MENIEKNLNDIAGVRVICSFPDDIYALAAMLVQQDDIRLIAKKDYYSQSQAERISKPSPDCGGAYFPFQLQEIYAGGGSVPYHCHGLLGQPGA